MGDAIERDPGDEQVAIVDESAGRWVVIRTRIGVVDVADRDLVGPITEIAREGDVLALTERVEGIHAEDAFDAVAVDTEGELRRPAPAVAGDVDRQRVGTRRRDGRLRNRCRHRLGRRGWRGDGRGGESHGPVGGHDGSSRIEPFIAHGSTVTSDVVAVIPHAIERDSGDEQVAIVDESAGRWVVIRARVGVVDVADRDLVGPITEIAREGDVLALAQRVEGLDVEDLAHPLAVDAESELRCSVPLIARDVDRQSVEAGRGGGRIRRGVACGAGAVEARRVGPIGGRDRLKVDRRRFRIIRIDPDVVDLEVVGVAGDAGDPALHRQRDDGVHRAMHIGRRRDLPHRFAIVVEGDGFGRPERAEGMIAGGQGRLTGEDRLIGMLTALGGVNRVRQRRRIGAERLDDVEFRGPDTICRQQPEAGPGSRLLRQIRPHLEIAVGLREAVQSVDEAGRVEPGIDEVGGGSRGRRGFDPQGTVRQRKRLDAGRGVDKGRLPEPDVDTRPKQRAGPRIGPGRPHSVRRDAKAVELVVEGQPKAVQVDHGRASRGDVRMRGGANARCRHYAKETLHCIHYSKKGEPQARGVPEGSMGFPGRLVRRRFGNTRAGSSFMRDRCCRRSTGLS